MNKEEILAKSKNENKEMDEYQKSWYQKAWVISSGVAVILCGILTIYCAVKDISWFGYTAVTMSLLGVDGLIFGIKSKETTMGKTYLIAGIVCILAGIFNLVLFFVRG